VSAKRLLPEQALIPYTAGFPPGRRWLVLAPHPDDEVFGIGATLAQAVARGVDVRLVIVTDGAAQGDAPRREGEARDSARELGLGEPQFWRFPDRGIAPGDARLRRAIAGALRELEPDTVMVTSPVDLHPDHRSLALATQRALRRRLALGLRRQAPSWLAAYEVTMPLRPNLLVAGDPAWDAKVRAAACYASQLAYRPYDRIMEALSTYRSLTLDGVRHAEALHVLPASRVARMTARGWAQEMGSPLGVTSALG